MTEADRNEAIAQAIMADMTDEDWENLNKIGEGLADEDRTQVNSEDQNTEDSTEGNDSNENSQTEENTQPFMQFGSKEELDAYINEKTEGRIARERRKASEAKERAEREAARKALEDQQKFEELYKTEQQRAQELEEKLGTYEELEEKHSTYVSTVESIANQRMESLNLPKGVKSLVEKMEPAERLQWFQENEQDFSGSTETIPASPNGDDPGATPEADEKARRENEAYTYGTF